MKTSLFVGVDIGTSAVKGVVIDHAGNPISRSSFMRQNYRLDNTKYEHDADQVWWKEFLRTTNILLKGLDSSKKNIRSIGITAMVPNILPVDSQGRPLRNAVLYFDGRAQSVEERLDAELGTAKWQNLVLAKLILLKQEMGLEWKKVNKILTTHNFIIFKLTGEMCLDTITALECGNILNANKMEWDQDLLGRYEIDANLLPEIVAPATVIGYVSNNAAETTGLSVGTPVTAGSTDMIGSFIGSGAWKENDMLISYGTYGCAPVLRGDLREVLFRKKLSYPIEWVASLPRSGQQLTALAQILLPSSTPQESLVKLDKLAESSIPGANGVIFLQMLNLAKSVESTEPMGAIFNLGKDNTLSDICRAMLEAFGYGLRYRFETSSTPVASTKCFAASGGAQSKIWRQIVSDITGLEQSYFPNSGNAFGSAVLGAVSIAPEIWEQIYEIQTNSFENVFPCSQNAREYDASYQAYKNLIERFSNPKDMDE